MLCDLICLLDYKYITYSISTCIFVFCYFFCRFCIACIKFPSILLKATKLKATTLHKNKTYTQKAIDCTNFDTGTEQHIHRSANRQLRIRKCKWIFWFLFINSKRFPDFSKLKKKTNLYLYKPSVPTYHILCISPLLVHLIRYMEAQMNNILKWCAVCNTFGISFILITNCVILFFPSIETSAESCKFQLYCIFDSFSRNIISGLVTKSIKANLTWNVKWEMNILFSFIHSQCERERE